MDISLASIATAPTTPEATSGSGTGALDQTAFLNLLTTQLQYQDPMDPQSSADFVAQLAQFSSLEQQMATNESLAMLNVVASSLNNASMTQLIGSTVVATSDTFSMADKGSQTLQYDAASATSSTTVTIRDENGTVVQTLELGGVDAGEGSFQWDGTDQSGAHVPAGTYTFEINATDVDGNAVEVTELIEGVIDGMSFESGTATPSIGDVSFGLGAIRRVIGET